MEYRVDIKGDTSGATAGAAALRDERAAAVDTTKAIQGVGSAVEGLHENTKAAAELAAALRAVAEGANAAKAAQQAAAPAFSTATDHDFKASKWETPPPSKGAADPQEQEQKAIKAKAAEEAKYQKAVDASDAKVKQAAGKAATYGKEGASSVATATKNVLAYGAALAGIGGAAELTKIAIGWRGAAQLQMLSYKATMDLRRAVAGVDPQPLVRGFAALEKNISKSTVTGDALSGILTRGFNGLFSLFEKGEPLIERAFQGMVLGALEVEDAWLDLRLAAQPLTKAIGDLLGSKVGMQGAADAGSAAFRVLAGTIEFTASALNKVVAAYRWLDERARRSSMSEEERNRLDNADRAAEEQAARDKATSARGREEVYTSVNGAKATLTEVKPEQDAEGHFVETGKALGNGIVKGLDDTMAAVKAAGGRAADAANRGAKEKAEIHSPSALTRREVGRQLGAGVELGVDDMAPDIQAAAARSLVPDVGAGAGGGSGGAPMSFTIGPIYITSNGQRPEDVREAARDGVHEAFRELCIRLGRPVPSSG